MKSSFRVLSDEEKAEIQADAEASERILMATTENSNKTNLNVIFTLTLVHFIGDFYSSFSTPLIPGFVEKFSLSMAQVGLFTGIIRFLAFIVQPSVGYFADRC